MNIIKSDFRAFLFLLVLSTGMIAQENGAAAQVIEGAAQREHFTLFCKVTGSFSGVGVPNNQFDAAMRLTLEGKGREIGKYFQLKSPPSGQPPQIIITLLHPSDWKYEVKWIGEEVPFAQGNLHLKMPSSSKNPNDNVMPFIESFIRTLSENIARDISVTEIFVKKILSKSPDKSAGTTGETDVECTKRCFGKTPWEIKGPDRLLNTSRFFLEDNKDHFGEDVKAAGTCQKDNIRVFLDHRTDGEKFPSTLTFTKFEVPFECPENAKPNPVNAEPENVNIMN